MRAALVAVAMTLCASQTHAMSGGPEIVVDAGTGGVLEQHDADMPWYPASLTKMMTLYVALSAISKGEVRFDDDVTISRTATAQPASRTGLPVGSTIRLDDALKVMMVKSANDISVAVAERIAGSVPSFVERMNQAAVDLGMKASRFANPNGLHDPSQMTTARDLAVLARALVASPAALSITSLQRVVLDGSTYDTGNGLSGRLPWVDGLKTGYTCPSGYNLVTSGTQGGRRSIVVVLGHPSATGRDAKAGELLEASFASTDVRGNVLVPELATNANPVDLSDRICDRSGIRKGGLGDADGVDTDRFLSLKRTYEHVAVVRSRKARPLVAVGADAALVSSATEALSTPASHAPPVMAPQPSRF